MSGMPGGFGNARAADADEQEILNSVRGEIQQHLGSGENIHSIHALKVTTQVVAGVNYLFKARINDSKIVHVKVCKPLPHTQKAPFVLAVDSGAHLTEDSPLNPI